MKIFQVRNGFCYWDATTKHPTLKSTEGRYAPDIVFVEAPNYVFEHWGFDETKKGDERFIKPTPPEGWGYDDKTGLFYELNPLTEEDIINSKESYTMMISGNLSETPISKEKITKWYNLSLWTKDQVKDAVDKNILTPEDYLEITGEDYHLV